MFLRSEHKSAGFAPLLSHDLFSTLALGYHTSLPLRTGHQKVCNLVWFTVSRANAVAHRMSVKPYGFYTHAFQIICESLLFLEKMVLIPLIQVYFHTTSKLDSLLRSTTFKYY